MLSILAPRSGMGPQNVPGCVFENGHIQSRMAWTRSLVDGFFSASAYEGGRMLMSVAVRWRSAAVAASLGLTVRGSFISPYVGERVYRGRCMWDEVDAELEDMDDVVL